MKKDVVQKTAEAVEEAEAPQDNLIRLSTGVVLKAKKANTMVLMAVMSSFPRPTPPIWHNETMGRDMENPDDPDYLDRVKAWEVEYSAATLRAFILLGTELESVPKEIPKPSSDKWLEEYEVLGLPMRPKNKNWRYLQWINFKAIGDEQDLRLIQEKVGSLSGITERAARSAEEFPGRE